MIPRHFFYFKNDSIGLFVDRQANKEKQRNPGLGCRRKVRLDQGKLSRDEQASLSF